MLTLPFYLFTNYKIKIINLNILNSAVYNNFFAASYTIISPLEISSKKGNNYVYILGLNLR